MKTKYLLAMLLALMLILSATPAFAQTNTNTNNDNVCFGGGNVTVRTGESVRDVFALGCNVTILEGAQVARDVVVFGGNADVASTIGRDVFVFGGNLTLAATANIGRDAVNVGGILQRADGAKVGRNVTSQNNGSVIVPPIPPIAPIVVSPYNNAGNFWMSTLFGFVNSLVVAIAFTALGVLLAVIFPNPLQRVMATAQNSFLPSFGVGCLTLLVSPMLAILLLLTLIGPVLYGILLMAAWVFGWTAIGYLAGERILNGLKVKNVTPILSVLVGILLLSLVSAVPCVGFIVWLLIGTLGVGAVVLTRFGTRNYPFQPALVPVLPAPVASVETPPTPPTQPTPPSIPPPAEPTADATSA